MCVCVCVHHKVLSHFVAEPQTGFKIAFKMLDTDGNEQVEKKEFFKVCVHIDFKAFKYLHRLYLLNEDALKFLSLFFYLICGHTFTKILYMKGVHSKTLL